ncbi:uncharacterized protein Z519_06572 [Cladophialophora bantiana CBS 173.52]|uniref:KANL3/Tex30 alpha/beta hydrolase-like domain-containing protein n=1 Tax=Cladophialophora bantiana (strain ATCC 10958 / CBS 173.52 / CDC B-1940 / NIH 8579) TaxID=1442370 RepID=A0A0D2I7A4_CLAB1|nr:uncharacterized protein Z519_06572 [Cladophialophora bantiana CBS 173.52]KIW92724.1 hypothetical protein Z519_06572 [Cladophialophora bantiana CBS 173.52]
MAPRTKRQTAQSGAVTSSANQDEAAKNKSYVQDADLHVMEDTQVHGGEKVDPLSASLAVETRGKSTSTTLPASLNLGSTSVRFTAFTISSASPAKSGKPNKQTPCLRSHPVPHPTSLIFTHGAGGDLSASAMVNFSQGFASAGSAIVMFQGSMNVKARASLFGLVKEHEMESGSLARGLDGQKASVSYGGRSMGARAAVIASHTDSEVKALVLASYPLVGPSGDMRDKILLDLDEDTDVLFISGDNDSMCPLQSLQVVRGKMKAKTWRVIVKGADHGMNIRGGKRLKEGTEKLGKECGWIAAEWLRDRDPEKREMAIRWDGDIGKAEGSMWAGIGTEMAQGSVKRGKKGSDDGMDEDGRDEDAESRGKRKRTKK